MAGLRLNDLQDLSIDRRAQILAQFDDEELELLLHDWRGFMARPNQLMPAGDWRVWYLDMGRGAGKTRSAGEGVREWVKQGRSHIALVAADAADARSVMVEGRSGMLNVCWHYDRTHSGQWLGVPSYNPSKKQLTWANGAVAKIYSGEDPEELRGPEHSCAWVDELAKYQYPQKTMDNLDFSLRVGMSPQKIISTTPQPLKLLRDLKKRPTTVLSFASTFDNAACLPDAFIDEMRERFDGTRLGRQELYAEMLDDVPGALWQQRWFDRDRVAQPPKLKKIAVAVDPNGSSRPGSDECGITAGGVCDNGHGYLLADASMTGTPAAWAKRVITVAEWAKADVIVAEKTYGGEMVGQTIRAADPSERFKIELVDATTSKVDRANPISALYEKGRIHHVGLFPILEEQMAGFHADWNRKKDGSPDRLDSVVHLWRKLLPMLARPEGSFDRERFAETGRVAA